MELAQRDDDEQLRVVSCNSLYYETFQTHPKQTEGELIYQLGSGQWDVPELHQSFKEIVSRDTQLTHYRIRGHCPKIGQRTFVLNAQKFQQEGSLPRMILPGLEPVPSGVSSRDDEEGKREK